MNNNEWSDFMLDKKIDREYKGNFYKGYTFDGSIFDAIEIITNSDLEIISVEITDKGDIGMKYFGGEYSYEKFLKMYDDIKFSIDTISFNLKHDTSIEISLEDKDIILITKFPDLDLINIFKKKSYK